MTDWGLVPNPAYAGRTPAPLTVSCHDGTPFLTVRCGCGAELHLHESQTAEHGDAEIGARCGHCGHQLVFPPGFFDRAFAQMRADGWIA